MRPLPAALFGAVATAATLAAAGALAGGGPPPGESYSPELRTIVAPGAARLKVVVPKHRSNKTIERAIRAARSAAFPKAVKTARREASALATAAGLRLAGPLGAARDSSPYGYYDPDSGRFGPGRWCGRIVTSRLVTGSDGVRRRVRRSHQACPVPRDLVARITVTFAVR
jgi:hypothetical protein